MRFGQPVWSWILEFIPLLFAQGSIGDVRFRILDTGGLADETQSRDTDEMNRRIFQGSERAVKDADLVFFLLDGKSGVTYFDQEIGLWLRRTGVAHKVVLVGNKLEGYRGEHEAAVLHLQELGGLCVSVC